MPSPGGHRWPLEVTLDASAAALSKLFFVLMVPGAARPPPLAVFRPIDLLWIVMAVSAAQWVMSLPSRGILSSPRLCRPETSPRRFRVFVHPEFAPPKTGHPLSLSGSGCRVTGIPS